MKKRSPLGVFFFPIITIGIYAIVWLVQTKEEMNAKGAQIPTAWLLIVPIANIFWIWKYAKGVEEVTGMGAVGVFCLTFFLASIGYAVVQSRFNEVAPEDGLKAGNGRLEAGNGKLKVDSGRLKVGSGRFKVGSWKSKLSKFNPTKTKVFAYMTQPIIGERTAIGLDIGTRYIKIVQLKKTSTGYSLEKYGLIELLPEVIVDREFMDRGALVENLRKVVEDSGIQEKKVSTVIAGKNVIIKKLMTKTPKRKEYQRVVQQLTQDNVPFDLKEIVIDAKKLREEDENTEFMIVGAKNEILYPMVDVLKEVGLVPCTADIIPFVLQAAYQKSISNEGAYLLMNIGFEHTLLVVIKDGHYFFDEEIPLGTRNFIEEIQRVCGVAADAAAQVLYGREVKDVGEPEATKAIGTASKRLLSRMERLLPEVSEWKAVIIGGGGAGISGVQKTFSDRFSASCEIVDPLKDMAGSKYPEESSMFDIAVGLAISRLEGIGVNLLPSEERVEERSRIVQALDQGLIFYSVVTTALILGIIGLSLSAKERKIEREIEDMRIQQEKLTDRVKEVKGLMAKESEIATKVRVIQDLSKHKFARVKLLDEVNRLIPHYTWLVALSEGLAESAGIKISVRGITTSNFAVSSFMKNLENSPSFTEVKLMYTQRGAIGETKTTEFEIAAAFKEQMEDSSAGKPSR